MNVAQQDGEVTIVVPCFNEVDRLSCDEFVHLVDRNPIFSILFIDDGSTDETYSLLSSLSHHPRISVRHLSENVGKAEAVRLGLLDGLAAKSAWVGYVDADLSVSIRELERIVNLAFESGQKDCIFGSRVRLCGNQIERRQLRHLTGRTFAFWATAVLGHYVYDTQAGIKIFRSTEELQSCLSVPFGNRWSFDVELFGRLGCLGVFPERCLETPLQTWIDQQGSKVSIGQGIKAFVSLGRIRGNIRKFEELLKFTTDSRL